ncbi:unnamed protein product [Dracunculus medinensis]|uniref:EamA domain-containing protein n=1 Tax=Dracunculus medinensis TaxID=318479 RepID=A0A0N4UFR7_DRAME|nr:unnamed protein product [Dracunculus medinensis]
MLRWADSIKVDGKRFNHPFVQSICMFIGEFSCLVVYFMIYFIRRYKWRQMGVIGEEGRIDDLSSIEEPKLPEVNPFIFAIPATCDIIATSIMYIGLNLTQASSFQMLRGAVIIFTGLFSVAFLGSRLQGFRWFGMGFVTVGLVIVGVSDIIFDNNPKDDLNGIITGDLLIVMAQIIVAIQMVVEQKFLNKYDVPPLLAVGLEGFFGFIILVALLCPMYYIKVPSAFSTNPYHRLEDIFEAFKEIKQNNLILLPLCLTIVSIAFFNFAGVTVTKELSATTRMVLDSVRTLVIWIFSIPLFGEKFIPVQLIGFFLLILGMFVYNDILVGPHIRNQVLPRMYDNSFTRWSMSFWGLEDFRQSDRESIINDVDDDN